MKVRVQTGRWKVSDIDRVREIESGAYFTVKRSATVVHEGRPTWIYEFEEVSGRFPAWCFEEVLRSLPPP